MPAHLRLVQDEVDIETLKKFNLIYLASPYTLYPMGLENAAAAATNLSGQLEALGVGVFSPIAYSHAIAKAAGLPLVDNARWHKMNDRYLPVCDALLIARMMGWQSSEGVAREIKYFEMVGKPIFHINPETLEVF